MGESIDYIDSKSNGQIYRVHCPHCDTPTAHEVKASFHLMGADETHHGSFYWGRAFQIVQCRGCDEISFRVSASDSESVDPDGEPFEEVDLYPPRLERMKAIEHVHLLPESVRRVYEETRKALASRLPVLAGIGLRTILETVCKEHGVKGKLNAQIDELVGKDLLTRREAETLHGIRTLGNDAAHDAKPHGNEQLVLALEIIENLLKNAYVFPELALKHLPKRERNDDPALLPAQQRPDRL